MERIIGVICAVIVALLVATGCGGGGGGAGDLPAFGSAQAVVDAMDAGGAMCFDPAVTDPSTFAADGATELIRCAPSAGEFPSVEVYAWGDGVQASVIEEYHRVTHCSRIDSISYVIGADWSALFSIAVETSEQGESASQDTVLAMRVAEATGGELRTIDC